MANQFVPQAWTSTPLRTAGLLPPQIAGATASPAMTAAERAAMVPSSFIANDRPFSPFANYNANIRPPQQVAPLSAPAFGTQPPISSPFTPQAWSGGMGVPLFSPLLQAPIASGQMPPSGLSVFGPQGFESGGVAERSSELGSPLVNIRSFGGRSEPGQTVGSWDNPLNKSSAAVSYNQWWRLPAGTWFQVPGYGVFQNTGGSFFSKDHPTSDMVELWGRSGLNEAGQTFPIWDERFAKQLANDKEFQGWSPQMQSQLIQALNENSATNVPIWNQGQPAGNPWSYLPNNTYAGGSDFFGDTFSPSILGELGLGGGGGMFGGGVKPQLLQGGGVIGVLPQTNRRQGIDQLDAVRWISRGPSSRPAYAIDAQGRLHLIDPSIQFLQGGGMAQNENPLPESPIPGWLAEWMANQARMRPLRGPRYDVQLPSTAGQSQGAGLSSLGSGIGSLIGKTGQIAPYASAGYDPYGIPYAVPVGSPKVNGVPTSYGQTGMVVPPYDPTQMQMPMMPQGAPMPPSSSDTVPAMLTPGEMVLTKHQQAAVRPIPGKAHYLKPEQRAALKKASK
jgi:hypothetical protein